MTPDEIRELNETLQAKGLKTGSVAAHEAGLKSLHLSLLAEIAAQLAEANEHLAKIANPLITRVNDLTDEEVLEAVRKFHAKYPTCPIVGDSRYQERIDKACLNLGIKTKG